MSFSSEIKDELVTNYAKARHCDLAELSALVRMSGTGGFFEEKRGTCILHFHTENIAVARKCFTLIEKTFNIRTDILIRRNPATGNTGYFLRCEGIELLAAKNAIVQSSCCKRAYIRGSFIASGSMSEPSKSYHLEIVCSTASFRRSFVFCSNETKKTLI